MNKDSKYLSRGLNRIPGQSVVVPVNELHSCSKMAVFPHTQGSGCCLAGVFGFRKEYAEVRFKNDRKDFFEICHDMKLSVGDVVAVESNPGHDIGIITLMGFMAMRQMVHKKYDPQKNEIKKIYRKAKLSDIQRWMQSIESEPSILRSTRRIITELRLDMKLNDVECQGDGTKAIFYYTRSKGRGDVSYSYFGIGFALYSQGDYNSALDYFNKFLEIRKDFPYTYMMIYNCYAGLNQKEKGEAYRKIYEEIKSHPGRQGIN